MTSQQAPFKIQVQITKEVESDIYKASDCGTRISEQRPFQMFVIVRKSPERVSHSYHGTLLRQTDDGKAFP